MKVRIAPLTATLVMAFAPLAAGAQLLQGDGASARLPTQAPPLPDAYRTAEPTVSRLPPGVPTHAPALTPQALQATIAARQAPAPVSDPLLQAVLVADGPLPPAQQTELSQRMARVYLTDAAPVADVAWQTYVNRLGRWIGLHSPQPDRPWLFAVLQGTERRAFATPDGQVFITQGLVDALQTEAALAAVLARQIAVVCTQNTLPEMARRVLAAPQADFATLVRGLVLKPAGVDDASVDALAYAMLVRAGLPAGSGLHSAILVTAGQLPAPGGQQRSGWLNRLLTRAPSLDAATQARLQAVRALEARNPLEDTQSTAPLVLAAQRLQQL